VLFQASAATLMDLRSSGIFTDVSGQHIDPVFKGQKDFLTLEDGTNTLSRNVGKGLPLNAA
jgi:hypothetical protein